MELDRRLRMALEPPLERHNSQRPAERKACDRDSDVQEHHHIVVPPAHRRNRHFLRREHEHQPSAREEERRERLSGWTRGEDGAGWPKPEEEVRETAEDGEACQEIAPQHMDLHLEEIRLSVRGHSGTCDTDAHSREGVEARNVTWWLRDSFL